MRLQRRREKQDTRRLPGGLQFRVDDHGQSQFFPQVCRLLAVIRRTDPGDGRTITDLFCHRTAQQVQFIGFCHSDKQISFFNPGLHLHTETGAIPRQSHNVIIIGDFLYFPGIFIDNRDIVPLFG